MNQFSPGIKLPEAPRPRARVERRETEKPNPLAIAKQCEDIAREFGQEALLAMLEAMQAAVKAGKAVERAALLEPIEGKTPKSESQRQALEMLEKAGIVEERADGVLIVEAERLFTDFDRDLLYRTDKKAQEKLEALGASKMERLGNAFAHQKVILRQDLERNPKAIPKPLFYLPEYQADALDIEKIKQADFYFGLWEIPYGSRVVGQETASFDQPGTITKIGFLEATIPALLYHPKYGAAKRDEKGRLLVRTEGNYKTLTRQWFVDQGLHFTYKGRPNAMNSKTMEMIEIYAPEIIKRGLLNEKDFGKETSGRQSAETIRVSKNGMVMIDTVRHYIGRKFADLNIRLDKLSDGRAIIVELDAEGIATPLAIMNVLERGNPDLKESKTNTSSVFDAGAKLTAVRELPEAGLEGYKAFVNLDNTLRQRTDASLSELDENDRRVLMRKPALLTKHKEQLVALAQTAGKDALELVTTLADNDLLAGETITRLSALPQERLTAVIPDLKQFAITRQAALATLEEKRTAGLSDFDYRKAKFELDRRIESLLTAAEDVASLPEQRDQAAIDNMLAEVAKKVKEASLYSIIFKEDFKGSRVFNFDGIPGLELKLMRNEKPSQDDIDYLVAMAKENWRAVPEMQNHVTREIRTNLENPTPQTEFYILRKDKAPIAYLRFDEQTDGSVYAASLNVDPQYRGKNIGGALIRDTMDRKAKDHVIHGKVLIDAELISSYLEDMNFIITDVVEAPTTGGAPKYGVDILRDDTVNDQYIGKTLTLAELNDQAETNERPDITVKRYHLEKNPEQLVKDIQEAQRAGRVITRFALDPADRQIRLLAFEEKLEPEAEQLPQLTRRPRERPNDGVPAFH